MTASADGPPAQDAATPADLRGLIDFLNSRASAKRAERFDSAEHAERFLPLCDLGYDGRPLTAADTRRLLRLRDALMTALESPADEDSWVALSAAATTSVQLSFAGGPQMAMRSARDNPADAVIARVLQALVAATITGRWDRLGACARCRRVFYDSTRSHTRRWCSYATCGNRANVANHRERGPRP
jgi:hypothetical protein